MPGSDPVEDFISENNAAIKKIRKKLDKATNKALPSRDRDMALSTAAHLACRRLDDLYEADRELWEPALTLADSQRYAAPRVPVPPELFKLFNHPQHDQTADLIRRADHQLAKVFHQAPGPRALVAQAKDLVDELRTATCNLRDANLPPEEGILTVRKAVEVIATSSIAAAIGLLVQHGWDAAPEFLRQVRDVLDQAGYDLDSVIWLGLAAAAAVAVAAADALGATVSGLSHQRTLGRVHSERGISSGEVDHQKLVDEGFPHRDVRKGTPGMPDRSGRSMFREARPSRTRRDRAPGRSTAKAGEGHRPAPSDDNRKGRPDRGPRR